MVTDVRLTLKDGLKTLSCFSIELDDSTNVKDTSQLAVFVHAAPEDMHVTEEFVPILVVMRLRRHSPTGKCYVETTSKRRRKVSGKTTLFQPGAQQPYSPQC